MSYEDFLRRKAAAPISVGIEVAGEIHPAMFPHQRDVTRWALARGRAALFLDTGLGKSICQLAWADHVARHAGGRVLVLAPLAVGEQTEGEARKWGIDGVRFVRAPSEDRIQIANYEMLHHFDPRAYAGVVLDESSILKNFNGATRKLLTESFAATPYRLACTATPSPNDYTELGTHSEWLGIKGQKEMLAEYFVHDSANRALSEREIAMGKATSGEGWRLKGHAHDAFWSWVTTWGALVRRPSDLGYEDGGYALPELRMHEHVIGVDHGEAREMGQLFASEATSLSDQRRTRRATMQARVELAARLAEGDEPCLIWCELNDEADAVTRAIPGAVQVAGSDKSEDKAARMLGFAAGPEPRVLVSKPAICGHGMNFQRCARMIFVGASHSFEATYQAIRRCWRFGQTRPVDVHVIRAETEGAIVRNFKRKEADVEQMGREMGARMREAMAAAVRGTGREWGRYDARAAVRLPGWL